MTYQMGALHQQARLKKPPKAMLFEAIEYNNVKLLEKFFAQGFDVNEVDSDGNSVLIHAVKEKLDEVTRAVRQNSAININYRRPSDGYSALMIAAANGHPQIVQQLLLCPDIDLSLKNNEVKRLWSLRS